MTERGDGWWGSVGGGWWVVYSTARRRARLVVCQASQSVSWPVGPEGQHARGGEGAWIVGRGLWFVSAMAVVSW